MLAILDFELLTRIAKHMYWWMAGLQRHSVSNFLQYLQIR
jgi:hypothetical protein